MLVTYDFNPIEMSTTIKVRSPRNKKVVVTLVKHDCMPIENGCDHDDNNFFQIHLLFPVIQYTGTEQTFRGFGVASLVVLVIFLAMQYQSYNSPKSDSSSSTDLTSSGKARSSSNRDEIQPVLTAEDVTPIPYSEKRDETLDDEGERDLERGEGGGFDDGRAPAQEVGQDSTGGGEF